MFGDLFSLGWLVKVLGCDGSGICEFAGFSVSLWVGGTVLGFGLWVRW